VQFTITPRDTWWWDEAANGWNQSTGHYGLFVGDPSALSDLPLQSGFDLGASAAAGQVPKYTPATNATLHATATLGPDAVREAGVSVGVS
jgi:hypothetical protein